EAKLRPDDFRIRAKSAESYSPPLKDTLVSAAQSRFQSRICIDMKFSIIFLQSPLAQSALGALS
ncbi:MAG: hypothetical protein ABFC85_06640, partial [Rectinema sp.]